MYVCLQGPGPFKKENYVLNHYYFSDYDRGFKKKKNPFLAPFPNVVFYCIYGKTQQLHAHKLQFR